MATADQLKQGGNAAKLGAMSPPPIARGFAPASGNSSTPNPGAARPHPVGKITGKGTGTSDQVPINASNGEFIIKAAAVKKIGLETLEALNSIADGPDEKDSKAEKLAEYGDSESTSEDNGEGPEQSEPRGFKCGGAVRKMATGGLVEDPKANSFGDAAASNSNPQVKTTPTVGVSSASSPSVPTPQIGTEVDRRKAYEVANQKVNDLAPSYFTQQTPTSGQALENAKKNADAAYQNILAPTPSAANPPTSAVTPAAPAAIAPPAVSAGPAATAPATAPVNTASPAGFEPSSNQVTKTTQPNGVTSYSGSNIAGDIALQNSRGFPIEGRGGVISAQNNQAAENLARKGGQSFGFGPAGEISGGGQVSSINTSAGYAADLKQLAGIEAAKSTSVANMRDQENYAAMKAGHLSPKAYQATLTANQVDQTARRGQDIHASSLNANEKLAQDKLGLEKAKDGREATSAGFASRSAQRVEALQAAYESAKPEDKAGIAEQIRVMTGKEKAPQWHGTPIAGTKNQDGSTNEGDLALYNPQTGEVKRASKAVTQAPPLQNHIDALKKDPKLAQDFDRQYGAGSSSKILGTK